MVDTSIYSSTMQVRRSSGGNLQVGLLPYSGRTTIEANASTGGEIIVANNIPCFIELKSMGRTGSSNILPANENGLSTWTITTSPGSIPNGVIRDRDLAVDDLGYRYELTCYLTPMGYIIQGIRLES
jgi:hypothetical protein